MSKEIDITCPECKAVFCVPAEFIGEIAECDECGKTFKIENPEKKATSLDIESAEIDFSKATHTVKLSRSGIGMIPEAKDNFQLGAPCPSATATKPKATASSKHKKKKAHKEKIVIPKWTNISIKNANSITGLKENSIPSWKVPLMLCVPVLFSGVFGIVLMHFAGAFIALVIVLVITIAVFASAPKGRKALVVTKERSICIMDKDRMEVKH